MPLYKLSRIDDPDYDEHFGFIVRANDEQHARKLAQKGSGNERYGIEYNKYGMAKPRSGVKLWMSELFTSCEQVTDEGRVGILLASFKAG